MMRRAIFLVAVLLSICSFTVCHALDAPFPTRDKPFAVKDSGVEAPFEHGGPIRWMDNDRVIFTAFRQDAPKNNAPEGLRIVIWDTAKNMITPYADGKLRCYSDGRIVYMMEAASVKSKAKQKAGEMGAEQLINESGEVRGLLNPYSCHTYSSLGYKTWDEINRPNKHTNIVRLHEDHGYLDLYTEQQQTPGVRFYRDYEYPIKYYRPNQPPMELSIVKGGISGAYGPVFSTYAHAYVLDQLFVDRRSFEASNPYFRLEKRELPAVRLLSPEGVITTQAYPNGLYEMTTAIRVNISRRGLLFSASAGERFNLKSKTTGLFLARNEKFVKLVDDVVFEMDVSPDGCKVAFVHGITGVGGWSVPGNSYTLKMIDVCSVTN